MSELVTTHWLFVMAENEASAIDIIKTHYVDRRGSDWALDAELAGGVVCGSDKPEFARVLTKVRSSQQRNALALGNALAEVDIPLVAQAFTPYEAPAHDGALGQTMAALGALLAGVWHPLSGGFDHVGMTADLSKVKARMKRIPDKQYAVAVVFTY